MHTIFILIFLPSSSSPTLNLACRYTLRRFSVVQLRIAGQVSIHPSNRHGRDGISKSRTKSESNTHVQVCFNQDAIQSANVATVSIILETVKHCTKGLEFGTHLPMSGPFGVPEEYFV